MEVGTAGAPGVSFTSTSGITGAGDVRFVGYGIQVAGTYAISGQTAVGAVSRAMVSFFSNATTGALSLGGPGQGTVTGTGDLTVNRLLTWTAGTFAGTGHTLALGGVVLSGSATKVLQRPLENAGAATWTAGDVLVDVNGAWTNRAGATFDAQANGYFGSFFGVFDNAGRLLRSAGTGTVQLTGPFHNTGTVAVQSGSLQLTGDVTASGAFQVAAGATLIVGGGVYGGAEPVHVFTAGSSISGAGAVSFRADFNNAGRTDILGSYGVGSTVLSGGAVSFFGPATSGTLTLSGGVLDGPGTLTATGLLTWSGGTMAGPGRTVAAGGLTVSGSGDKVIQGEHVLDNAAAAAWTGTGSLFADLAFVNNLPGATFEVQADATFRVGTFTNAGTFRKSGDAGTATIGSTSVFHNAGTLAVTTGTLQVQGELVNDGTASVAAGATLLFQSGEAQTFTASSQVTGQGVLSFNAPEVDIAGTYHFSGSTLIYRSVNFLRDATLGSLTLAGELTGTADVTVTGSLDWQYGSMSGDGRTLSMGTLTIPSTMYGATLDGRTLDNAGTALVTSPSFQGIAGAVVNNLAGGTWVEQLDGGSTGSLPTFHNAGTFRKLGRGPLTPGATIINTGLVDVQAGTLGVWGSATSSGRFTVADGAVLVLQGQTLTSASSVTGDGSVSFAAGASTVAGSFSVGGTTRVNGGTVNFVADATLAGLDLSSGTFAAWGSITVAGTFAWTGGTLGGAGTIRTAGGLAVRGRAAKLLDGVHLVNAADATWADADVTAANGAAFTNQVTATLDVQSDAGLLWNGQGATPTFANAGTLRKSGGAGTTTLSVAFANTGLLEIQTGTVDLRGSFRNFNPTSATLADGTYRVLGTLRFTGADIRTNAATLILDGPAARIVDQADVDGLADLAVNADAGSLSILNGYSPVTSGDFRNDGALAIGDGSTFTPGGVFTQTAGTTLLDGGTLAASTVFINGGSLAGTGTVNADVVNGGVVSPGGDGAPGLLTITGDYVQTADGTLDVEIGGYNPGSDFDQLAVAGTATLDGTLNVSLINGFVPSSGSTFQVLTAGSLTGTFATENVDPSFLPAAYDPTGVTLQAL